MQAAEQSRAPLILSIPEYGRSAVDLAVLLPAVEAAARMARVPVAIMLDHATTLEAAVRGIKRGCNGLMIDRSDEALAENISITNEVVEMAHGCGIPVEAELGSVPDAKVSDGIQLTTVEEAKGFVVHTGVDFLAVSIGTAHGRIKGRLRLDSTRLRQINKALSIPLVIHGGTGLDEAQIQRLVANGAAKINFFTALDEAAGSAITNQKGRFTDRTCQVSEIITSEAEKYIRWCGAAGRAAEVIIQCRPSEPLEPLII